jgi:hypothetical protein
MSEERVSDHGGEREPVAILRDARHKRVCDALMAPSSG